MTKKPATCPHCGAELDEPAGAGPRAAIGASWEALRRRVGAPGSITAMLAGGDDDGAPRWWLPSLALLAHQTTDREDARAALDEFAERRDELRYAVVEERTDGVIGLTYQPWPLLDGAGRLRFPIDSDPMQVEASGHELAGLLHQARQRWHELGVLPEPLVTDRVEIGDAFALAVHDEPRPGAVKALPQEGPGPARYLGGLPARAGGERAGVPVVDVTWDAREAGKLAHYAAVAGVATGDPDAPDAPVVAETNARYLVSLSEGVDPRDVVLPGAGDGPAP